MKKIKAGKPKKPVRGNRTTTNKKKLNGQKKNKQ